MGKSEMYERGRCDGREWAEKFGTAKQIERVADITDEELGGQPFLPWDDATTFAASALGLDPREARPTDPDCALLIEKMFGHEPEQNHDYLAGFRDSVAEAHNACASV